jgi:hypothetical protein
MYSLVHEKPLSLVYETFYLAIRSFQGLFTRPPHSLTQIISTLALIRFIAFSNNKDIQTITSNSKDLTIIISTANKNTDLKSMNKFLHKGV